MRELKDLEFIREHLRDLLPRFARDYGLRPWDLERLTGYEIAVFLEDMDRVDEAARQALREAERG